MSRNKQMGDSKEQRWVEKPKAKNPSISSTSLAGGFSNANTEALSTLSVAESKGHSVAAVPSIQFGNVGVANRIVSYSTAVEVEKDPRNQMKVPTHGSKTESKAVSSNLLSNRLLENFTVDNSTYLHAQVGATFYPKFENEKSDQEVRTRMIEMVTKGLATLEISLKHSRSLFMYAGHEGGAYAKNSYGNYSHTAVGVFVLGRMFRQAWGSQAINKQAELNDFLESNRMSISMELVTAVLGDHGQRPREDYVVVTAVTELGCGKPKFYSTPEIIAFCRKWRLPTNHVWLFSTRKSVASFFAAFDALREEGAATSVCKALDEVADISVPGSIDHMKTQGEILEGLVARIVSGSSSEQLEQVLRDYPLPPLEGGTKSNPFSLDALAVFIYRVLHRVNHPGNLDRSSPNALYMLLMFYHLHDGKDRKEFETELTERFGSLVKMPLLEPDRSPLPESVRSILEEGINLFKLHSGRHGRMEPTKGIYAKDWAKWEKELRETLLENGDYFNSIQNCNPQKSGTTTIALHLDGVIYGGADGRVMWDDDSIYSGTMIKLEKMSRKSFCTSAGRLGLCIDLKSNVKTGFKNQKNPTQIMEDLKMFVGKWKKVRASKRRGDVRYPAQIGLCGFRENKPYMLLSDKLDNPPVAPGVECDVRDITFEGKTARVLLSGGGSVIAGMHLERIKKSIFEPNANVREIILECLAVSAFFCPCTGGHFHTLSVMNGCKVVLDGDSPHLLVQIANSFDKIKKLFNCSLIHVTKNASYKVYNGKNDEMNEHIKNVLKKVVRVNVIGVESVKKISVRHVVFENPQAKKLALEEYNDMVKLLKNPTLSTVERSIIKDGCAAGPKDCFLKGNNNLKMCWALLGFTKKNFETLAELFKTKLVTSL